MSSSESYFYYVKFLFSPLWMCLLFYGQVSAVEDKISQSSFRPLTAENVTLHMEGSGDYVDDEYYDEYNTTATYKDYFSNYVDLEEHNNVSGIISGHNHGNSTEDQTVSGVSLNVTDTINGLEGMNGSEPLPYLTYDSTPPEGTTLPTLIIYTDSGTETEENQNGPTKGTTDLKNLSSLIGGSGFENGPLKGESGSQVIPTNRHTSGPFGGMEGSREGETGKATGESNTPSAQPLTPASSVLSTQPLTISPVINLYPMLSPFVCPTSCTCQYPWTNPCPSISQYSWANPCPSNSPYPWTNPWSSMSQYSWANPCPSTPQYPWTSQYQCLFHNHMNQLPPQYPYPYSQTYPYPQANELMIPPKLQNTPGAIKPFPSFVSPGNLPGNPFSLVERLSSAHVTPPIPPNSLPHGLSTPGFQLS